MLALSRKEGERIVVGKDIVIEIRAIFSNRVVIGVIAPEEVVIDREEVSDRRKGDDEPAVRKARRNRKAPPSVGRQPGLKTIVREIDVRYAQRALCFETAK